MRAKSFHGAPNCERPQETSQNTYSIRYKCMLNLSMGLPIARDLKKHRKTHIQLGKMHAKSFHGGSKSRKTSRNIAKHVLNRYKCMLNLSMGLPIVKGVNKHRRIQQKVIE